MVAGRRMSSETVSQYSRRLPPSPSPAPSPCALSFFFSPSSSLPPSSFQRRWRPLALQPGLCHSQGSLCPRRQTHSLPRADGWARRARWGHWGERDTHTEGGHGVTKHQIWRLGMRKATGRHPPWTHLQCERACCDVVWSECPPAPLVPPQTARASALCSSSRGTWRICGLKAATRSSPRGAGACTCPWTDMR